LPDISSAARRKHVVGADQVYFNRATEQLEIVHALRRQQLAGGRDARAVHHESQRRPCGDLRECRSDLGLVGDIGLDIADVRVPLPDEFLDLRGQVESQNADASRG
jgi:hypothetical protein